MPPNNPSDSHDSWQSFCRLSNFPFAFSLIAFLNIIIFLPSLKHFFYGDDYQIFANQIYAPARFALTDPNHLLFCPFHHAAIFLESILFKNNFFLWRLANLTIHLSVLFIFLKLLRKLTTPLTAFFLAACFSSFSLNAQTVTWTITNRYMLFFACILGSFYYLHHYFQAPAKSALSKAAFYITIACFFYEIGIIAAILSFFCLVTGAVRNKAKMRLGVEGLMLLPIIIYATSYFLFNGQAMTTLWHVLRPHSAQAQLMAWFVIALLLATWWLIAIFFPSLISWDMPSPIGRLVSTIHKPETIPFLLDFFLAIVLVAAILLAIDKVRVKRHAPMVFLSGTLLFLYAIIIALGRGTTTSFRYVFTCNAYYSYVFSGLLTILAACLIDPAALPKRAKKFVLLLLIIFLLRNAFYVFKLNYYLMEKSRIFYQYERYMKIFIKTHQNERDFSLRVNDDVVIFFSDPQFGLAKIFCRPQYLNPLRPKYIIALPETDFYKEYVRENNEKSSRWYSF